MHGGGIVQPACRVAFQAIKGVWSKSYTTTYTKTYTFV